ncbi:MAG: hypothetical protein K0Q50_2292 [Vampirovibrio sp.]|jgi:hypothetical protein|nr:hypothetical protein [Vampirovibrio sp.]
MTNPNSQYETIISHELEAYENPEAEAEWENLESESEWESYETEGEWESLETESEWETPNAYYEAEDEYEWESEYEGDAFSLSGVWKGIKKVGRVLKPFAKKLAPKLAGSLVSMIPGVGPVLSPLASKATKMLLKEGEAEAEMLEAEMLVSHEGELEIGESEVAQQTALTEYLAAQAAEAQTEAEAEAALAASLPITITIMGGSRALRPVVPVLAQANARLVAGMRRQGPAGRELLRTIPTIQRNTIGALKAAARRGKPITAPLAIKTMAAATQKALSSPSTVARAVERNNLLRKSVAPAGGIGRPIPRARANGGTRRSPLAPTFRPGHKPAARRPIVSRYI